MNEDQLSPANEVERDARELMQRAFQNGATLAGFCRALAACLEAQNANTLSLEERKGDFQPCHVAFMCFARSMSLAELMVRWLENTAARLDMVPADETELERIMRSDGATYAAFKAKLSGRPSRD